MIQGQFFKQSKADLNSEFSFISTGRLDTGKEISLPYYLSIAETRKYVFMPFPRAQKPSVVIPVRFGLVWFGFMVYQPL